jgi:hypothetical protein
MPQALSAVSGSNYHTLTLAYNSNLFVSGQAATLDLAYFKPVCYIKSTRIKRCTIDSTAKTIVAQFQFALANSELVDIYFSVLDPRNPNTEGFLYNPGASSNSAIFNILRLQPSGGTTYYVESDPLLALYSLPSLASSGPHNGISSATFSGYHTQANRLNFIQFQVTFARTDVTGLVIELPMVT